MGSSFEIRLPASTPGAVDLACRALDLIDALEAQMTVYRDDSEVSRLNASAHLGPVPVEPGLFRLLQDALNLSRETGGAYDVTSGRSRKPGGSSRGRSACPTRPPSPRRGPGPAGITSGSSPDRTRSPSTAKGSGSTWAASAKAMRSTGRSNVLRGYWWPTSGLVHGGRSSLFALGSPPGQFGGRWEVTLRNPFQPESPLGMFRLRNRALGTSGAAFQQFVAEGRAYGHIIDPRSGEPAFGPASVTVLAPTAAAADALSTAFYLLGPDATADYVAAHPEIGAVIVEPGPADGDGSPRVLAFGVSESDYVAGTVGSRQYATGSE